MNERKEHDGTLDSRLFWLLLLQGCNHRLANTVAARAFSSSRSSSARSVQIVQPTKDSITHAFIPTHSHVTVVVHGWQTTCSRHLPL
jgi:hypothetical protein